MNLDVLNSLPTAAKAGGIPAKLETPVGPLTFLYNPERLKWSRQAVYSESATVGTPISAQELIRSGNRVLDIPDLLLDSQAAGKSLRPLLEGLELLLLPPKSNVFFVWGSERFGPAVVQSMDWEVTGWLSGEPAIARLNLSLLGDKPKDAPVPAQVPDREIYLTERQQAEGATQGAAFARSNFISPEISAAIADTTSQFVADQSGLIEIVSSTVRETIGTWTGRVFNAKR